MTNHVVIADKVRQNNCNLLCKNHGNRDYTTTKLGGDSRICFDIAKYFIGLSLPAAILHIDTSM